MNKPQTQRYTQWMTHSTKLWIIKIMINKQNHPLQHHSSKEREQIRVDKIRKNELTQILKIIK